MRVLVTGGSGLVGAAIKKVREQFDQYEVLLSSSKECDLLDYHETVKYLTDTQPDVVVHLAANVGGLFKNMNQKVNMFEDNIMMNMNVVRACYRANVNQFIGMLSTCIFPDKTTYPIDESMLQFGPPHFSNDAYAYAKRMLKVHCDTYNEQHDTNYSCIIPTNIYGENDNYHLQDAHVIPALIHKCFLAKQNDQEFNVAGTGSPLRQFIHADDLAMIIMTLIDKLDKDCVIASDSVEISIKDVATYIARAFDYEHMMRFDNTQSDGQYKKTADNSKLRNIMPDYKFKDIETGINSVVKHFKKNYNTIRK